VELLLFVAATSRRPRWLVSIFGAIDLFEGVDLSGISGGS
jgi:hypothetical protein